MDQKEEPGFILNEKDDIELVKLSLVDKEAFLPLMRRYEERLFSYILRISGFNKEEVEDILQEVFLAIYRNLHNFDEKLSFSSWAYRIAHNKTVSRFRFKKARPQTISLEKSEVWRLSNNIDLLKEVDENILSKQILNTLNDLKDKHREVLILKYLEEKSYQEISDILKKPAGSIATLLKKAKENFKINWLKRNKYEKRK